MGAIKFHETINQYYLQHVQLKLSTNAPSEHHKGTCKCVHDMHKSSFMKKTLYVDISTSSNSGLVMKYGTLDLGQYQVMAVCLTVSLSMIREYCV